MAFRRETIPATVQERLIDVGKGFGSGNVLNQIEKHLAASRELGAVITKHGFGPAQQTMLAEVREALLAAGVGREEAIVEKKVTNANLLQAMFAAKTARFTAHGALESARFQLELEGKTEAVNTITAVLEATRRAGANSRLLQQQLMHLRELLDDEDIHRATSDAEDLARSLTTHASALEIARRANSRRRGTPEETELIDLLDGVGIELCRMARKAARAAARALGQPSIAERYELDELYKTVRRRSDIGIS